MNKSFFHIDFKDLNKSKHNWHPCCLSVTTDLRESTVPSLCRLSGCGVSGEGCDSLAHVLTCKQSKLAELDLSYNHLDGRKLSGAKPTMKLE